MKICAAVVLYNKSCRDSLTCQTLLRFGAKAINPLILDNSTRELGNAAFCEAQGWRYLNMGGNTGLSKAYNRALELFRTENVDLVVWADDDTVFPEVYASTLETAAKAHPEAMVFLPVVMSGETIVSPALYGKYHIARTPSIEALSGRELTAINSGMAVRLSAYDNYRYPEEMFLDYLDHDFMRYCREKHFPVFVLRNTVLKQSFFADSRPNRSDALRRRKLFEKDFRIYSKACGCFPPITALQLLKGRIRMELTCTRKGKQ